MSSIDPSPSVTTDPLPTRSHKLTNPSEITTNSESDAEAVLVTINAPAPNPKARSKQHESKPTDEIHTDTDHEDEDDEDPNQHELNPKEEADDDEDEDEEANRYIRVKTIFSALRQYTNLAFPEERKLKFNPRLTRDELVRLQEYLGFELPPDFVATYSRQNGHDQNHPVQWCYGGEFLTTDRIIEEVEKWRVYSRQLTNETDPCRQLPPDKIHGVKQQSWNNFWVPFVLSQDKSEFLCIDMDPNRARGGCTGQIISVSWYPTVRQYVTTDIIYFLELLTEKLLYGDITLTSKNEEGSGLSYYCSMM